MTKSKESGVHRYHEEDLWEELAYLGRHLHFSLEELLDLAHRDRHRLVSLVARMNTPVRARHG